jgi:hypothetical protein
MIKNNYLNLKLNKSFILDRDFNLKTNPIKNKISYTISKKNKIKVSKFNKRYFWSLINKANYEKGFKKV